jgi:hypothetical protein
MTGVRIDLPSVRNKFSTIPNKERKTHLHVRSGLSSDGRPHGILRSRQKVQARLGWRGSLMLLDDLVLPVSLAFGGGIGADAAQTEGFDGYVGSNDRQWDTFHRTQSVTARQALEQMGLSSCRPTGF